MAALPDSGFVAKAKELAARFAANNQPTNQLNPLVARAFNGFSPTNLQHVASLYSKLFKDVEDRWQIELALADPVTVLPQGQTNAPPPKAFKDATEEALRQVLYADSAPANPPRDQFGNLFLFDDTVKNRIETLNKNIVALDATHPGAPARAMVITDKPKPVDVKVFIRGNPGTPGPLAPRRFLEIAAGSQRDLFPTNASGRLEMARALVSRDNPLTARVFVNRVWLNHFGAPLVTSPGDFGLRAEEPVQRELLDYLAARFMDDGWSVKKLHRLILLSSTYQQGSGDQPAYAKLDPANKYLWRMNRRRLDFEALRDSLLAVSTNLDLSLGGQPLDITTNAPVGRRTVYGYVDRQDLPNLFRVFDFANPDTSSPQRFQTIVAPQALYLLNSQFVIERVKGVVGRCPDSPPVAKRSRTLPEEARIRQLYQLLFQRDPTRDEIKLAGAFIQEHPNDDVIAPEVVAWKYGSGIYDESSERIIEFTAMTNFNGKVWQFAPKPPDARIGALQFDAEGGQPAATNAIVAVRRWMAPRDGHVSIKGQFSHGSTSGDGVRGRIVSSRQGKLGEWVAFNNQIDAVVDWAEVKKGDTLDFVTDCRANSTADTFKWSPVIQMMDGEPQVETGQPTVWDAKQNFADPLKLPKTLNAWEELAQVLLLSNEFAFLD